MSAFFDSRSEQQNRQLGKTFFFKFFGSFRKIRGPTIDPGEL